jgi:hypothetical protein
MSEFSLMFKHQYANTQIAMARLSEWCELEPQCQATGPTAAQKRYEFNSRLRILLLGCSLF